MNSPLLSLQAVEPTLIQEVAMAYAEAAVEWTMLMQEVILRALVGTLM